MIIITMLMFVTIIAVIIIFSLDPHGAERVARLLEPPPLRPLGQRPEEICVAYYHHYYHHYYCYC